MSMSTSFQAFRIRSDSTGYRSGIEAISIDDLAPGEIVIKTAYSSVNYKDAQALCLSSWRLTKTTAAPTQRRDSQHSPQNAAALPV